jgi:hypothetical protein
VGVGVGGGVGVGVGVGVGLTVGVGVGVGVGTVPNEVTIKSSNSALAKYVAPPIIPEVNALSDAVNSSVPFT